MLPLSWRTLFSILYEVDNKNLKILNGKSNFHIQATGCCSYCCKPFWKWIHFIIDSEQTSWKSQTSNQIKSIEKFFLLFLSLHFPCFVDMIFCSLGMTVDIVLYMVQYTIIICGGTIEWNAIYFDFCWYCCFFSLFFYLFPSYVFDYLLSELWYYGAGSWMRAREMKNRITLEFAHTQLGRDHYCLFSFL